MLDRADLVLSISATLAELYPGRDIELLPNGVNLSRFSAARAELAPVLRDPPVVGYLGAFEYFIDFEMILGAAALLPGYRFRLVGGGRDFDAVRARVQALGLANVELPGPVPFDRVPGEIGGMDVCLNLFARIPISHRACPMKLFEYLAMGKPVLTTVLDEVRRYGADFLIEVGSAEETAAAIQRLVEKPEERARRARAGLDWVAAGFDWKTIAQRFAALVEERLDARRALTA
jgi:glycosyltransferase involved in cell wall biosynthesis